RARPGTARSCRDVARCSLVRQARALHRCIPIRVPDTQYKPFLSHLTHWISSWSAARAVAYAPCEAGTSRFRCSPPEEQRFLLAHTPQRRAEQTPFCSRGAVAKWLSQALTDQPSKYGACFGGAYQQRW